MGRRRSVQQAPDTPVDRVQMAREDLAYKLRITWDLIRVRSFSHVIWPDGSLGCADSSVELGYGEPTPGYVIVLEYPSKQHIYHGAVGFRPFLCRHFEHNLAAMRLIGND